MRGVNGGLRFPLEHFDDRAITGAHGVGEAIRGQAFTGLWRKSQGSQLTAALEAAMRAALPLILDAEGRNDDGDDIRLEILFAPLADANGVGDRFLGLYQPLAPSPVIRGRPIGELSLLDCSGAEGRLSSPRLRLAALDGRRIA